MTEKQFQRREYAIYEKGNSICMTLRDVDNRLNELWEENKQLKESVDGLKETILKITVAYHRKYDRTIVDLVDEEYDRLLLEMVMENNNKSLHLVDINNSLAELDTNTSMF